MHQSDIIVSQTIGTRHLQNAASGGYIGLFRFRVETERRGEYLAACATFVIWGENLQADTSSATDLKTGSVHNVDDIMEATERLAIRLRATYYVHTVKPNPASGRHKFRGAEDNET